MNQLGIDVSDGLLADLGQVATASGVIIDLDGARLEIGQPVQDVARATGREALEFVLTGGEDHALAAAFPYGQVPDGWAVIGRVLETGGATPAVLVDGQPWPGPPGWSHFQA